LPMVGIVARIPLVHMLVQTINPVGGGREINDLLLGNGMRNKLGNWMTDEHVGLFDVTPEIVPDVILGRSVNGNEVTSDLDVRSVEDRAIRGEPLDHRDKPRHLGIINENDVGTALLWGPEWAALREPVSLSIVFNPVGDGALLCIRDALVGVTDTLENVVLVLGDSENARSWFGNIPSHIYSHEATETDEGVTHDSVYY
jgi:hypothetical protein